MSNEGKVEQLKKLALEILNLDRPSWSLRNEVLALAQLLNECATFEIDAQRDIADGETQANAGLALSPTMAAMCADDYARSVAFIRGLHDAVHRALQRSESSPVQVLYAGCGPYALLAVPLMAVFTPEQVNFTLLDIHQASIDSAQSIAGALGLTAFITNYVVTDACLYEIAADQTPNVIVTETMNAALEKEPQVMISRHLLGQAPGAALVPQSVRVDAVLVDTSKEFAFSASDEQGKIAQPEPDRIELGTVFELSAESIKSWESDTGDHLPGGSIQIPDPWDKRYQLMLFTRIDVFAQHTLREHQSGLTNPRPILCDTAINAGQTLQFHYELGSHPTLVCKVSEQDC